MDPFSHHTRGLDSPASRHFAINPSDSTDLALRPRFLWVEAAGQVVLRDETGVNLSYTVAAGQILPFSPIRVMATGTTATVHGQL